MPELPEVETVKRGLAPVMEGGQIVAAQLLGPGLRYPFPPHLAAALKGRRIIAVRRRAKFLLIELSGGQTLISHLGMSGSWRIEAVQSAALPPAAELRKHDHVILLVRRPAGESGAGSGAGSGIGGAGGVRSGDSAGGGKTAKDNSKMPSGSAPAGGLWRIIYNDPRRFGFLLLAATEQLPQNPLLADLGVEPLGNEFSAAYLQEAFKGRKTPLKAALLDQHIIAGLGNIYSCESLWRAQLSPFRAAGSLGESGAAAAQMAAELAQGVRSVLEDALAAGGSHLRNYVQTNGSLGGFQHNFQVYGRAGKPCRRCGAVIENKPIAGRSSFYCGNCQK